MGLGGGTDVRYNFPLREPSKANLNKKMIEEYWPVKTQGVIEVNGQQSQGSTFSIGKGYFFITQEQDNYQIPYKRVNVSERTIEGNFIHRNNKVKGIIKKL